jgi:hypothetical protein
MKITKRKFRWIGHTLRKADEQPSKVALQWNAQGNREKRTSRNSWRGTAVRENGRSWSGLRYLVADRDKWKKLLDDLCS